MWGYVWIHGPNLFFCIPVHDSAFLIVGKSCESDTDSICHMHARTKIGKSEMTQRDIFPQLSFENVFVIDRVKCMKLLHPWEKFSMSIKYLSLPSRHFARKQKRHSFWWLVHLWYYLVEVTRLIAGRKQAGTPQILQIPTWNHERSVFANALRRREIYHAQHFFFFLPEIFLWYFVCRPQNCWGGIFLFRDFFSPIFFVDSSRAQHLRWGFGSLFLLGVTMIKPRAKKTPTEQNQRCNFLSIVLRF